jgi:hypothetical protein
MGVMVLFAVACGGEQPVDPPPQYGPLVVGGGPDDGTSGYVELTDGQDVTLVPGAQGGFHVYLNVRVEEKSMNADHALYIDRKARRIDTDQLVSQNRQLASFIPAEQDEALYETEKPMLMFLCPAPIGIQVNDQTLTVKVQALLHHKDPEPIAEGTIRLTPRCPENTSKDFCLKICSGE